MSIEFLTKVGFYKIGEHMTVQIVPFARKRMPSGEVTGITQKAARIDLVRNIKKENNGVGESRRILLAFIEDLIILIDRIKAKTFPNDVKLFYGTSHLGGLQILDKLGFIRSEPPLYERIEGALVGMSESKEYSLKSFKKKMQQTRDIRITQEALLASEQLLRELLERYKNKTENVDGPVDQS